MSKSERDPEDYFNPDTYEVRDMITGEILDVKLFIEKVSQKGWQKTYVKDLCNYMEIADGAASKVLSYVLENKTQENLLLGTYQEVADKSGVSKSMVQRVFKKLIEKDMITNLRTGCHILERKILCNGNTKVGSMVLRLWTDARKNKKSKGGKK